MFSVLGAVILETLAILTFAAPGLWSLPLEVLAVLESRAMRFSLFLVFHAGASLLIAIVGWHRLPEQLRNPRWGVLTFLATMSFFIPVLGILGFSFGIIIAFSIRRIGEQRPFLIVHEPEFLAGRTRPTASYRSTNAREDLADMTLPEEMRLKALLSIQDMPGRVAGALLHDLLSDKSDDLRLLAYGMLRGKERDLAQRIIAAMERRLESKDKSSKYLACRELAELNWEFIYQNLVSGDMKRHATRQGFNYAIEAIQIQDDDPGLWFVAGRLAMSCGLIPSAHNCLQSALDRGFPRMRVLPYLAECAFMEHELDEVRELLKAMPENEVLPGISPVIEYWT